MPKQIVVIGAGIGGLTAGALLARRGYDVTIYDQAIVPGGCASTFKRRGFTFDVGATQVAGLEAGGIHQRIFEELGVDLPESSFCDPACAVFLPGESNPINVWRNPQKWQQERQQQFPHSEPFWQLMDKLFRTSWQFQSRNPILPPRNLWDVGQLWQAMRLDTLVTVPFVLMTVGNVLRWYGLYDDIRLKTFLDLQLKLYSQVNADETAVLYAATALAMSQAPHGLYHLTGSMQVLSDRLVEALEKHGGRLFMRHRVDAINSDGTKVTGVEVYNQKTGKRFTVEADLVVANVTVQNLAKLVYLKQNKSLIRKKMPQPSGAFVIYLGVEQEAIPPSCPLHLQFLYDNNGPIGENNSLFVSVSQLGDGRAPEGKATLIASTFTNTQLWWQGTQKEYQQLKQQYTSEAIACLNSYFHLTSETIIHTEAATPRTFARFTAREKGIVGGIGQRLSTFGPFSIATRTSFKNLWLVGDSTHPGEGTAGVSYSALTAVRQIEAKNGKITDYSASQGKTS